MQKTSYGFVKRDSRKRDKAVNLTQVGAGKARYIACFAELV